MGTGNFLSNSIAFFFCMEMSAANGLLINNRRSKWIIVVKHKYIDSVLFFFIQSKAAMPEKSLLKKKKTSELPCIGATDKFKRERESDKNRRK